jgi:glutathione synthase/RimK-type ligase-like ATP-grasp enzyme/gamma-glutamyl:cysteine ligase YbdK (ATP-grasp superfamily)
VSGRVLVVVSTADDLPEIPAERLLTADRYLAGVEGIARGATVVNLCRSYRYRSKGYYVSLIADARGQQAVPTAEGIEGLSEPFGILRVLNEAGIPTIDASDPRARHRGGAQGSARQSAANGEENGVRDEVELLAYFGVCTDPRGKAAAQAIYREWPTPVLRLFLVEEEGEWALARVSAVPMTQLGASERPPLIQALNDERRVHRRGAPARRELKRASIAILYDQDDPFSPSTPETLERLERVAARLNVHAHRIGLDDLDRLGEYDALFIRTLTGVREPSFQFALRAEMLDMPVIDDPQSIIRCSNKVFLEELLRRQEIATPRTLVVTSRTDWSEVAALGLPVVVKLPDGSFSAAVHKCASEEEYERITADMFRRSPLLIAQEFLPTDFDWRITVLNGRVLFAARYFMARGHWQIRTEQEGHERFGRVEAVKRDEAPRAVRELGIRAAALIGTGLYGVDIKETARGPVVIEINDNPNLDIGYDDAADGGLLYEDLIRYFLQRIEETPGAAPRPEDPPSSDAPRPAPQRQDGKRHFRPFEVAGLEIEYAVVDRDLNVVSMVAPALRALAGRPTSDVDLGDVAFSNEIADHVFELKTPEPTRSLREAEQRLVEGAQRFSAVLRDQFGARLLPTGMHPWLDPRRARIWSRSNTRIYGTYARLFDVQTHGWMNVQSTHLNLPMGRSDEAVAMMNAAALVIPYLPAIAASSPMYEGELQEAVDNRLAWILKHQARIPESQGWIVPEYAVSLADYRRNVLGPMYHALDMLPEAGALRHEFFNARGAVFKFSRRALEIRVLDTQECVKMDVAVAVFVRSVLRAMVKAIRGSRLPLPPHALLVDDFRATIAAGSEARVWATHLGEGAERDDEGKTAVREVLRFLLEQARREARKDEQEYLDLAERIIATGSLSERIRAALIPASGDEEAFTEAARHVYIELADCLDANEPWRGRGL